MSIEPSFTGVRQASYAVSHTPDNDLGVVKFNFWSVFVIFFIFQTPLVLKFRQAESTLKDDDRLVEKKGRMEGFEKAKHSFVKLNSLKFFRISNVDEIRRELAKSYEEPVPWYKRRPFLIILALLMAALLILMIVLPIVLTRRGGKGWIFFLSQNFIQNFIFC